MHTTRVTYRPALTKSLDVVGVLKDRTRQLHEMGLRVSLLTRVIFTEGWEFQLVYFGDTYADFDSGRSKVINSPTRAAFIKRIESLLREPPTMRFFETVVPLAKPLTAGQFLWRGTAYLADPMQEDAFIAPTAEFTRNMQKAGINAGLVREHFAAPHGQTVQALAGLNSFAAVEDFWKASAKTPGGDTVIQAWAKVPYRKPMDSEMWEVVLAAPARPDH